MLKSKYRSIKKFYDGRLYHSKKEAAYAQQLDIRKVAGELKAITPQFRIPLAVNDIKICDYVIDFQVVTAEGETQFHEVKGYGTYAWKLKWKLLKALLPSLFPKAKLILVT